jgi:hypothetical protein
VDELVVRVLGGVHALFGALLLATGIGLAVDSTPNSVSGWFAVVLGIGLMTAMLFTGLRLGLGDPVPRLRAAVMIVATLMGGLLGASLVLLTVGR